MRGGLTSFNHAVIFSPHLLLRLLLITITQALKAPRRVLQRLRSCHIDILQAPDARRTGEAQTRSILFQRQRGEIKHLLVLLHADASAVAHEGLLAEIFQLGILKTQTLQLSRDRLLLRCLRRDLCHWDLCRLQPRHHRHFLARGQK